MKKKILLIDDEELVIKSVSKLLTREGYEVAVCRSGDEAIQTAKNQTFDLIVCDIRMPNRTGLETIKEIREIYRLNNQGSTPEILMTGYADEAASKEAESLKVADYIYKPFDLRDFMSSVKKSLKE